ncbi:hypothetical protein ACWXVQ_02245 [Mycoplasma sp. 527]
MFYERITNVKISYSQLTRRLTQSGFLSAFAHKNTIKRQRTFVKNIPYKPNILPKKDCKTKHNLKKKISKYRRMCWTWWIYSFFVDQTLWRIVACSDVSSSKVLSLYFDKKRKSVKGY